MKPASTKVSVEIAVSRDRFFYWFMSADLPRIMPAYGLIPGVVGVKDQTGPMHIPGSRRVLLLSDGNTAVEETTSSDPPRGLKYRLHELTNVFRHLVAEAQGELLFREVGDAATRVEWRYSFFGRNSAATLVLKPLISLQYAGFMKSALTRAGRLAEEESRRPGK
jgi:hypothetical protein